MFGCESGFVCVCVRVCVGLCQLMYSYGDVRIWNAINTCVRARIHAPDVQHWPFLQPIHVHRNSIVILQ